MARIRNPFKSKISPNGSNGYVGRNGKKSVSMNDAVMREIKYTANITGRPNFREWDINTAIIDGYKASTWVYTSVNKISRTAASVDWICFHKNADGTKGDRWPEHPFEQLMKEPNPYTNGQDWKERTYQHLWLGGNGISRIVSLRDVPVALVQMMPNSVKPVPDENVFLNGYDVYSKYGAKTGHLENSEVLHLMFADPSNMYWGISPLQAVAKTVDTDVEAVNWNKVSLQNRAVSDGVFVTTTEITPDEWNELRAEVREQAQGSDNAHNPWVLGYGMDWKPMSLTPVEMDFLESRKNNRTEILAVYGMPPPMAGIYDEATYNNVHTARLIWWLETIIPFLQDVKVALEFGLAKRFGTDFIIDYDLSNVDALEQLRLARIDSAVKLWQMGVPLNEINRTLDLGLSDDIPGADIGYLPMSYYPVTTGAKPTAQITANGSKQIIEIIQSRGKYLPVQPTTPRLLADNEKQQDLSSRESRIEYYKAFDATRLPWERKLQILAEDQYLQDIETLASAYESDLENGIMGENLTLRNQWYGMMFQFAHSLVQIVGTDFYNQLTDTGKAKSNSNGLKSWIKQDIPTEGEFRWDDPNLVTYLENWCVSRSGYIVDTTLNDVLDRISSLNSQGYTQQQIVKEIRGMSNLSSYRSNLISKTEVVGFHNYAHHEAAVQTKVVNSKKWISSADDRVRDSHKDIDGKSVPIDMNFKVGTDKTGFHDLKFPGDPMGPPSEIIHCRCALAYERVEDSELFTPQELTYQGWSDVDMLPSSQSKMQQYYDELDQIKMDELLAQDVRRIAQTMEKMTGVKYNYGEVGTDFEEDSGMNAATYISNHNIVVYPDNCLNTRINGDNGYDTIVAHELVHTRGIKGLSYHGPDPNMPAPGFEEGIAESVCQIFAEKMGWYYAPSLAYDAYVSGYANLADIADVNYDAFLRGMLNAPRNGIDAGIIDTINKIRVADGKTIFLIDDVARQELMEILQRDAFSDEFLDYAQYDAAKLIDDLEDFFRKHESEK
jgi:HK97 family phage portal protein